MIFLFLLGFLDKICCLSLLNQILLLIFLLHRFLFWHYSCTSYAVPAILNPHFLQYQIPTAFLTNLTEPQSGHFLFDFKSMCTCVYCFRGFRPYLFPSPLSDEPFAMSNLLYV